MKDQQQSGARLFNSVLVIVALLLVPGNGQVGGKNDGKSTEPFIQITLVPPGGEGPDSNGNIGGKAGGANLKQCRVVVFARTDKWYVQPYAASPYTSIGEDGNWETGTHLGYEYAALLVEASYKPPATTGALPGIAGDVLAIARVPARANTDKKPDQSDRVRMLQFAGYQWRVKSSSNRVGPGPNYFSDSRDNVEVDSRGRLHLRISNHDGRWSCAEVISTRSFGYGSYRFYVDSVVDGLDPKAVLGLFTWNDDSAFSHRELDIEISKWGQADNKNGQFVVQPYTSPQNIVRFQIPAGLRATTHSFKWRPDSVIFRSLKGRRASPPRPGGLIQEHVFRENLPRPGGENARINLWLLSGQPPANGKEIEIIISRFEFSPLP